jgi:hypothetical protein
MLRIPKNNLASVNNPVLRHGGMSSSELLNQINERIESDLSDLQQNQLAVARGQDLLAQLLNDTASGIQGLVAQQEQKTVLR